MNIFLVPYTWMRHFQVALVTAAAGVMAWWCVLTVMVKLGAPWSISWDGAVLLGAISGSVAGASVLVESTLRRQALGWRVSRTLLAAAVSGGLAVALYWLWWGVTAPLLPLHPDAGDPSLVALRYRLMPLLAAGLTTAVGPLIVRRGAGLFTQSVAGLASGLVGAALWQWASFSEYLDLYVADALLALGWGASFGLLAWGIPDDLYAGWLRVVSRTRHALRIPVDAMDRSPKERFVGHFPRGLDLWLPADDAVMEMHLSVAVDERQRYRARGLSLYPTRVRRFLERIDIRYDPRRPAPLETRLRSGDVIELGESAETTLEFLMLPREER